jgi:2-iminoacetate synthase ThiH
LIKRFSSQDILAVEQKVKELQERVGHLIIIILHHVTPKNEEGSEEAVVKTVKGIEEDIKTLVRCGLLIVV